MRSRSSRRVLSAVLTAATIAALHSLAYADACGRSCTRANLVCKMQARTSFMACVQSCGAADSAASCKAACVSTLHNSRTACLTARSDCGTTCPVGAAASATAPDATSCESGCGSAGSSCFADAGNAGRSCWQACIATGGSDLPDCLQQCTNSVHTSGGLCLATLEVCLANCQMPPSGACFDTIAMECTAEACSPDQPCNQASEFCSPRCASPIPSGICFDTVAMQCTTQTCSPNQPCSATNQTCVPQCPPPAPAGKCFDTQAQQCTDQRCMTNSDCTESQQICTLQCPPPPLGGTCLDTSAMQCTGQACSDDQPCPQPHQRCVPQCPPPTPVPQCDSTMCQGDCALPSVCDDTAKRCPESAVKGVCTTSSSGSCSCVPVQPSPLPTPTPQCNAAICNGPCIARPCPAGVNCNGIALPPGQCQMTATGDCECVLVQPSPPPTPTPQCGGNTCGGPCNLFPPCPAGVSCNGIDLPPVACQLTASGSCECLPVQASPPPTPTPQCGAACNGMCSVVLPCADGSFCENAKAFSGQCEMSSSGSCDCVLVQPSPPPTPTPQCGDSCNGTTCVISPPCPFGDPCPLFPSRLGMCEPDASGNCSCVPVPQPTPTPQCAGSGDTCGGPCNIVIPCPDNATCNEIELPLGRCMTSSTGSCDCVPVVPSPPPTPMPQCGDANCSGPCFIAPQCPPGEACPEYVMRGECSNASGMCQCLPPPQGTPTVTPTPGGQQLSICCECPTSNGSLECKNLDGGEDGSPTCPSGCTVQMNARCEESCGPGPASGPPSCVPIASCNSDMDCTDNNACTADACVNGACVHRCVCD